jgi:hypothetical protein
MCGDYLNFVTPANFTDLIRLCRVELIIVPLSELYRLLDAIVPAGNGCHVWPKGPYCGRDYGTVPLNGRTIYVHRLLLERKLGRPIRPGYLALHTCDNPSCCNPDHLYEGTYSDNILDAVARQPSQLGGGVFNSSKSRRGRDLHLRQWFAR